MAGLLFPWRQAARRAAQIRKQMAGGANHPFQAKISAVNTREEHVQVEHYGGSESVRVNHPAVGMGAWIRFMPDRTTNAVLHHLGDTQLHEIAHYFAAEPTVRVNGYLAHRNAYFPMKEGEIDINSRGQAAAYFSNRGLLRMRGGINQLRLDQPNLEIWSKSPTHRRNGPMHQTEALTDEERYGVVKRQFRDDGTIKLAKETYVKVEKEFAKEYLRIISVKRSPGTLIDHREGDVVDDEGDPVKAIETDNPLRARSHWYTKGGQKVQFEMDELGNVRWSLPVEAESGIVIRVEKGSWDEEVYQDISVAAIKGDITQAAVEGTMTNSAGKDMHLVAGLHLTLTAAAIDIDAPVVTIKGRQVMRTGETI
jgi:hypothetical protein